MWSPVARNLGTVSGDIQPPLGWSDVARFLRWGRAPVCPRRGRPTPTPHLCVGVPARRAANGRRVGSPVVDFEPSAKCKELMERLEAFMEEKVLPAEPVWVEQMAESGDPHHHAQIVEDLKAEAKARGLW